MAEATVEPVCEAPRPKAIALIVGPSNERIDIAKDLLCLKSPYFAKHHNNSNLTEITLPVGLVVCKLFVTWCQENRLPTIDPKGPRKHKNEWKELFIDLWIFADTLGIPQLQNETMKELCSLFLAPTLLTKEDVDYIWRSTRKEQLRDLVVCVLVAQIETPLTAQASSKIIDKYEDLAALKGFTGKLYRALKMWCEFAVPSKKGKQKWGMLLMDEDMQTRLRVEEPIPVVLGVATAADDGWKRSF